MKNWKRAKQHTTIRNVKIIDLDTPFQGSRARNSLSKRTRPTAEDPGGAVRLQNHFRMNRLFLCEMKDDGETDDGFSPNMPEHIDVAVLNLTGWGACCWRVAGYFVASSLLAGFPLRASRAPQLMCPARQPTLTGP